MTEATEQAHTTVPATANALGSFPWTKQRKPGPTTLKSKRAQTRPLLSGGGRGGREGGLLSMQWSGRATLMRWREKCSTWRQGTGQGRAQKDCFQARGTAREGRTRRKAPSWKQIKDSKRSWGRTEGAMERVVGAEIRQTDAGQVTGTDGTRKLLPEGERPKRCCVKTPVHALQDWHVRVLTRVFWGKTQLAFSLYFTSAVFLKQSLFS